MIRSVKEICLVCNKHVGWIMFVRDRLGAIVSKRNESMDSMM